MNFYRLQVLIGIDPSSLQAGAREIENTFQLEIARHKLQDEVNLLETGSLGYFGTGVAIMIYPGQITYVNLKKEDVPEIVTEHFLKGKPVKRLMLGQAFTSGYNFNYRRRIVLENSGLINPENIREYLGRGGYESWEKALLEMKPVQIVDIVKNSGLRGRGGAGFPTGLKWSFTQPLTVPQKYFVINADEGEPGTFKDRLIMEGDPHKLLEGLMISSYAVGATKAYIYIRGEYRLCINRLQKAIDQARELGLLGSNIFGTGFDLDIEIKIGAGAYVCGEETALIESMEGNRGQPRSKPPFPGVKGAWQKPTVVNNVETIANIPSIISHGADWFRSYGTESCPGTKVFTILGDVYMPGLCEVDMGTSLRTLIEEYGGGIRDDKKFKGALLGGAAGVFLSEKLLDVKMDFNSLKEYGAVLGSGAILVMNEDADMVDMLYAVIRFFRHESCGKCIPCSKGTQKLYRIISRIRYGEGSEEDLVSMIRLAQAMNISSFCALGQSLLMPIRSVIDNFRDEFLQKMDKKYKFSREAS
ncbi:MAG: NADH-quinone oxidoreductase subunit NuoF [Candidatus Cloacimonetes bacterium]|nr:NADH-quinone oxidoreductase subunit NuoF [Candidatus Cloacimonadota bacterium]